MIPWALAAVGAVVAAAARKPKKPKAPAGGSGSSGGGGGGGWPGGDETGDGFQADDSAIRVRCEVCRTDGIAYVHRTMAGTALSCWIRMPPNWTYPLLDGQAGALRGPLSTPSGLPIPASVPLNPAAKPVVCRCPKHGFVLSGIPVEERYPGETAARVERSRAMKPHARQPVTFEALHAYDITAEVMDVSDLEAVREAIWPMLGVALMGRMTVTVVGLGRMWMGRSTVTVRLYLPLLAGGHTVRLEKEYQRENIGSVWFREIRDLGLGGWGG